MIPRTLSSDPARRPDYWYLAIPAATMVFAGTFAIAAVHAPSGPVPYYFLPFWLGVIAVPGYVMAWLVLRGQRLSRERNVDLPSPAFTWRWVAPPQALSFLRSPLLVECSHSGHAFLCFFC
jgi:hypothetical protein